MLPWMGTAVAADVVQCKMAATAAMCFADDNTRGRTTTREDGRQHTRVVNNMQGRWPTLVVLGEIFVFGLI